MADNKKTGSDSGESRDSGGAVDASGGGKHKHMPSLVLPLVIVSVLIGLGGVGVGGYFLITRTQAAQAATDGDETEDPEETPTETNIYFEDFPEGVVNLAVTDDSPFTYLKYAFTIEVDNEEVVEELETELPRLTSKVAMVMSNLDWNEICTTQGRERVAREAMRAINQELQTGQVIGLYFDTFVAQ